MFKWIMTLVLACVLVAAAHPVTAAEKIWRIGWLTNSSKMWPSFRQGMSNLGYVEGKNYTIEFRQRKRPKTYLSIAQELVRLKVDIIVTIGIVATRAAKQATTTIPIVMGNASANPVKLGLIDSLARPGGNVTGVIDILPRLAGKRVELLKEIFPNLSLIAHLGSGSRNSTVAPAHLKATETAARILGVQVQVPKVESPKDIEKAFQAAKEGGAEALIIVGTSFFIPHRPRILKLAAKYRLPTMHTHVRWAAMGGLITYMTDVNERYRRAARFVDKILKGAKPTDLPVEQPTKFSLEINLKTAKALGVTFPPSVLLRATKVID